MCQKERKRKVLQSSNSVQGERRLENLGGEDGPLMSLEEATM
ncbi:hypothetical protein NC652_018312 [Populus alba x Populus x berolinensis]|nr:hypothetical protein NC652_018312 [Populus alba x Populus x berolinensis]